MTNRPPLQCPECGTWLLGKTACVPGCGWNSKPEPEKENRRTGYVERCEYETEGRRCQLSSRLSSGPGASWDCPWHGAQFVEKKDLQDKEVFVRWLAGYSKDDPRNSFWITEDPEKIWAATMGQLKNHV